MKTTRVLRWVIVASLGTVAACGGVSDIGSGDDEPNGMGNTGNQPHGIGGATPIGGTQPGTGAKPGTSGGAMGVGGGAPVGTVCMKDFDCAVDTGPCEMCEDGSYACPTAVCVENRCLYRGDTCATTCEKDMDCPVRDIACTECGDGSRSCPTTQCVMGVCQTSFPGCGEIDPCANQVCGAECKPCGPDGMCAPDYASYCTAEGKCVPGIPQCGMDPGTSCDTTMDCPTAPPECVACGNETCAGFECIENKCVFACPANPDPKCMTTDDCPPVDAVCIMCPGSGECAVQACLGGACQMVCKL